MSLAATNPTEQTGFSPINAETCQPLALAMQELQFKGRASCRSGGPDHGHAVSEAMRAAATGRVERDWTHLAFIVQRRQKKEIEALA